MGINWRDINCKLSCVADNIASVDMGDIFSVLHTRFLNETQMGLDYWSQRLNDKWIIEVEVPSRFLFSRAKSKAKRLTIFMLQNSDGNWVEEHDEIKAIIGSHLQDLYRVSKTNPSFSSQQAWDSDLVLRELALPQLSMVDYNSLLLPIQEDEVKKALFSIGSFQSPGYDGFASAFYKVFWDLVGDSLFAVVQSFFNGGFLLREWNHTLLVLIPKTNTPETVHHLRPISLCNTVYKCISKCLVMRMKLALPSLI